MIDRSKFWIVKPNSNIPILEEVERTQQKQRQVSLGYVNSFRNCLDIGSHVGFWTRDLAEKFSVVHCFEPNHRFIKCFEKNIQDEKVWLHKVALHEQETYVTQDPNSTVCITDPGNIFCKPLDSFMFTDVDFIKIDVDGFEHHVLQGAEETLKANNPVINIELKPEKSAQRSKNVQWCRAFLDKLGYKFCETVKHDEIYLKR